MSIQIKICGLTQLDDVKVAIDLNVDYLGFVFAEKSIRKCSNEQLNYIFKECKNIYPNFISFKKVLVFGYDSYEFILKICESFITKNIFIQLPYNHVDFLKIQQYYSASQIIPTYSISSIFANKDLDALLNFEQIILDTGGIKDSHGMVMAGGTGKVFDWNLIQTTNRNFFVAGGLNIENIHSAIHLIQPKGIDVSSGIEKEPGIKDIDKMKKFIQIVRSY